MYDLFDERLAIALSSGRDLWHYTGGTMIAVHPRMDISAAIDYSAQSTRVSASAIIHFCRSTRGLRVVSVFFRIVLGALRACFRAACSFERMSGGMGSFSACLSAASTEPQSAFISTSATARYEYGANGTNRVPEFSLPSAPASRSTAS